MNIKRLTQAMVLLAALGCVSTSVLAVGTPPPVPDGGSSALLLGAALGGTAMIRRLFSRK